MIDQLTLIKISLIKEVALMHVLNLHRQWERFIVNVLVRIGEDPDLVVYGEPGEAVHRDLLIISPSNVAWKDTLCALSRS